MTLTMTWTPLCSSLTTSNPKAKRFRRHQSLCPKIYKRVNKLCQCYRVVERWAMNRNKSKIQKTNSKQCSIFLRLSKKRTKRIARPKLLLLLTISTAKAKTLQRRDQEKKRVKKNRAKTSSANCTSRCTSCWNLSATQSARVKAARLLLCLHRITTRTISRNSRKKFLSLSPTVTGRRQTSIH